MNFLFIYCRTTQYRQSQGQFVLFFQISDENRLSKHCHEIVNDEIRVLLKISKQKCGNSLFLGEKNSKLLKSLEHTKFRV